MGPAMAPSSSSMTMAIPWSSLLTVATAPVAARPPKVATGAPRARGCRAQATAEPAASPGAVRWRNQPGLRGAQRCAGPFFSPSKRLGNRRVRLEGVLLYLTQAKPPGASFR